MPTARERQKRLERKRRKRQDKQRALRARRSWGGTTIELPSVRPMSDALHEYAEILLRRLAADADANDWGIVLDFAAATWNMAVTGEDDERAQEIAPSLCEALGWPAEEAPDLIEEMVNRKHDLFPTDDRLVVGVKTIRAEHGMKILAASAYYA